MLFFQLERRTTPNRLTLLLSPLIALGLTMLVCSLLVLWAGAPIGRAYTLMIEGSLGSRFALAETLTRSIPLMLTGLACAVAFRAHFYNIGGEGQLYLGALAAAVIGGSVSPQLSGWPAPLLFILMMSAAALAGGLWLLIFATLKTRLGVDEVVTTLLGNFIVLLFVSMMLDGVMKDPLAMGWPQSVTIDSELQLSRLMARTRVHSGLVLAVALAIGLWLFNRYTVMGFKMRAVGANAVASRFLGLPVSKVMLWTALLSGALAGLAGAVEVAGRTGYVTLDMSPGYGYTGVVVAMLARLHPIGVIFASLFLAAMQVGADSMSRVIAVPNYIADVIVATALIAILVVTLLANYQVKARRARPTDTVKE